MEWKLSFLQSPSLTNGGDYYGFLLRYFNGNAMY